MVVIGSGDTAMTQVPALADAGAASVTMLQRSPTYVMALPAVDPQQPLVWAGTVMAGFRPSSAFPVLERVVLAIAGHRKATTELGAVRPAIDEPLWAALRDVGLDPLDLVGRA